MAFQNTVFSLRLSWVSERLSSFVLLFEICAGPCTSLFSKLSSFSSPNSLKLVWSPKYNGKTEEGKEFDMEDNEIESTSVAC